MARATADYLTAEFNRTNQVINRALPMLHGADKVEATKLAGDYLTSLAKQVEAAQAVEEGRFIERAGTIEARKEWQAEDDSEQARALQSTANEVDRNLPDRPAGDSRPPPEAAPLEAVAMDAEKSAMRERAQAAAPSREDQAIRANPGAPVPSELDLPRVGEELREDQELLIDQVQTQRLTQGKIHRQ